jgi:hypothetical protein
LDKNFEFSMLVFDFRLRLKDTKMKWLKFLLFQLYICTNVFSQEQFSAFFIGDAGNDEVTNETLTALKQKLQSTPGSFVFFMGDNIYPQGLDGSPQAEKKLIAQLDILKEHHGEWVFIPGNHDWKNGLWKGYECIIRQQNFIAKYAKDTLENQHYQYEHFYPKDGMPGPVHLEKGNVSFIITDTDWWLHRQFYHKVGKTDSYKNMEKQYLHRLDSLTASAHALNKTIVFLCHHPLKNYGVHAQSRQPWMFLVNYTPFQLFGLLGVNRALMSEMRQPRYKRMSKKILNILDKNGPYICISGHEHNLQHIVENNAAYLISGSGSKLVKLPKSADKAQALRFAKAVNGFIELRFTKEKNTALFVYDQSGKVIHQSTDVMN